MAALAFCPNNDDQAHPGKHGEPKAEDVHQAGVHESDGHAHEGHGGHAHEGDGHAHEGHDGHSHEGHDGHAHHDICLLYTSPSPRDLSTSRMPSSA